MRDRIPTQVLDNGAVRMEQFDENGNHIGYVWLKRADEPIQEGTAYNVNNMLTDETATSLGLNTENNPTPNDAFARIASVMRTETNFETILNEKFSDTATFSKSLEANLFDYEKILIEFDVKNISGDTDYFSTITASFGGFEIGTNGYRLGGDSTFGRIYFENTSPIKLYTTHSVASLSGEINSFNFIAVKYVENITISDKIFKLESSKSKLVFTGVRIYGEKSKMKESIV